MIKLYDGRDSLFQWDLNRKIIVSDPTVTEVHFCNKTSDCSLVVEVKDGIADIPNIILQTDWPINVYAYCGEHYTKEHAVFKVNKRTKPDDYVYTETEVKRWEALEQRMHETLDGIPEAEAARQDAENERQSAEAAREEAEEARVNEMTYLAGELSLEIQQSRDLRFDIQGYQDVIDSNTEVATYAADKADDHETRLTNIEHHINDDYFITTGAKDIPANACPYIQLNSIGGMTYKCNNLIPFPYAETTKTQNGITYTVNADGAITLNGTSTAVTTFAISRAENFTLPKGTYTLSGFPSGFGSDAMMYVSFGNNGTWTGEIADYGSGATKDISNIVHTKATITIYIKAGATFNNAVVKPMLNAGSTALPYEPYYEGLKDTKPTAIKNYGANVLDIDEAFAYWNVNVLAKDGATYTYNSIGNGFDKPFVFTDEPDIYTISKTSGTQTGITARIDIGYYDGKTFTSYGGFGTTNLTYTPTNKVNAIRLNYGGSPTTSWMCSITELRINRGTVDCGYTAYREPFVYDIPGAIQVSKGVEGASDTIDFENSKKITKCKTVRIGDIGGWSVANVSGTENPYINANGWVAIITYNFTDFDTLLRAKAICSHLPTHTDWKGGTMGILLQNMTNGNYLKCWIPASWMGVTMSNTYNEIVDLSVKWMKNNNVILTYALAEPTETDIDTSNFDNILEVEAGGRLELITDSEKDAPMTYTYLAKEGSL